MGKFIRTAYVTSVKVAYNIGDWCEENDIRMIRRKISIKEPVTAVQRTVIGIVEVRFFTDEDYEFFCYTWLGEGVYLYTQDVLRAHGLKY